MATTAYDVRHRSVLCGSAKETRVINPGSEKCKCDPVGTPPLGPASLQLAETCVHDDEPQPQEGEAHCRERNIEVRQHGASRPRAGAMRARTHASQA
jgi:hypothetical protein